MELEDTAWLEYKKKAAELYDEANYTSSLQAWVMRAGHKLSEKSFDKEASFSRVLEVGGGTGEHFPYVRHKYDSYTLTDMSSEVLTIAKEKISPKSNGKISFDVQTGERLSYDDNTFDRVIAAHLLEHIYQPHLALKEWSRVIKPGGNLTILIPTDPGLAWRLGRNLGPRKRALSKGIAYDYVMAREHVNSSNNLIALLKHYFPE